MWTPLLQTINIMLVKIPVVISKIWSRGPRHFAEIFLTLHSDGIQAKSAHTGYSLPWDAGSSCFFNVKYEFSHFSCYLLFKYFNLHFCGYIIKIHFCTKDYDDAYKCNIHFAEWTNERSFFSSELI